MYASVVGIVNARLADPGRRPLLGLLEIKGKLVIPITPLNTSTTKFTLPIHGGNGGLQEYRSYENEKGEVVKGADPQYELTGDGFSEAGISMAGTNEVTASSALTIKD